MPGARILLVEDDPIIRDLLQRNLVARGHEVRVAEDAGSALLHLQSTHFNLIILDINLPDQTGWEVLRTALQNGWLAAQEIEGEDTKLPVVVLSAVRVSPRRLDEFHPLAYLPKPFPMEAILRLAREAAGRRYGKAAYQVEEVVDTENPESDQSHEVTMDTENPQPDEEELHA
ncbi:MAG TPA: response regulator [Ktedonobacteraceae bacterium]|nr:response regulator [Ktedonobacteraceae bacterium]